MEEASPPCSPALKVNQLYETRSSKSLDDGILTSDFHLRASELPDRIGGKNGLPVKVIQTFNTQCASMLVGAIFFVILLPTSAKLSDCRVRCRQYYMGQLSLLWLQNFIT